MASMAAPKRSTWPDLLSLMFLYACLNHWVESAQKNVLTMYTAPHVSEIECPSFDFKPTISFQPIIPSPSMSDLLTMIKTSRRVL